MSASPINYASMLNPSSTMQPSTGNGDFDYAGYLSGGGGGAPSNPGLSNGQSYPAQLYNPQWNTSNPGQLMNQEGVYEANWGNQMDSYLAGQEGYANQQQNFYQQPMNAEAGNIGNTPGYTSGELQNILGNGQYQAGETTASQYAAMNPTSAQSKAMQGNPNSLMGYYNPQQISGDASTSAAGQKGDFNQVSGAMTGDLTAQQNQLYGPYLSSVEGAFGGYQGTINSDLANSGGAITSATSSSNPALQLQLSPQQYNMSNQQVQDTINQAAQGVQTAQSAQMNQYQREAAASGNADPMAMAALATQSQLQANEGSAAAMTNASLAATGQQRNLAMNYAQAQLGAGQTQTGMNVGAQENLLGENVGAQQNLLGQQMGEANNFENQALGLTNSQVGAQEYLGNTGINMYSNIGNQDIAAQEYNQSTGEGLAAQVNQLNTGYANQQYQNQLANQMYAQQNTFNQNTAVQDRQSASYQAAANARMGGQNEFLNWATGQVGQAVGEGQTATQQRIGAAQTTFGGMNQSANNWGNYQNTKNGQPGLFGQIAGGLAGFAQAAAPLAFA